MWRLSACFGKRVGSVVCTLSTALWRLPVWPRLASNSQLKTVLESFILSLLCSKVYECLLEMMHLDCVFYLHIHFQIFRFDSLGSWGEKRSSLISGSWPAVLSHTWLYGQQLVNAAFSQRNLCRTLTTILLNCLKTPNRKEKIAFLFCFFISILALKKFYTSHFLSQ